MVDFFIKKAQLIDCERYFQLLNDRLVRESSFSSDIVDLRDHERWFTRKINAKDSFLYLAEEKEKKMIGQVRFDCVDYTATIDYSIVGEYRGKGIAKRMLKLSINKFLSDFPSIKVIYANVKESNIASSAVLFGLGFQKNNIENSVIMYQLIFDEIS